MAVKTLPDYVVELTFTTGEVGQVNLREWIVGRGGIFAPLEDPAYFAQVAVEPGFGTIVWPNGVDFCPDALYHGRRASRCRLVGGWNVVA